MTNKLEFVLNKIREKCPELMECGAGRPTRLRFIAELRHFLLLLKQAGKHIEFDIAPKDFQLPGFVSFAVWCEDGEELLFKTSYDLTNDLPTNLKDNPELLDFIYSLFNQKNYEEMQ